jgi:hypothetical protein
VYGSPQAFVGGCTHALWIAGGLSALGIVAALLAPGRRRESGTSAAHAMTALWEPEALAPPVTP